MRREGGIHAAPRRGANNRGGGGGGGSQTSAEIYIYTGLYFCHGSIQLVVTFICPFNW